MSQENKPCHYCHGTGCIETPVIWSADYIVEPCPVCRRAGSKPTEEHPNGSSNQQN